jgi:hypothetical protein
MGADDSVDHRFLTPASFLASYFVILKKLMQLIASGTVRAAGD